MNLEYEIKYSDWQAEIDLKLLHPDFDLTYHREKCREKYHMMGFEEFENIVPRYKSVNMSVKYLNGSIIDTKHDILSGNRKTNKK